MGKSISDLFWNLVFTGMYVVATALALYDQVCPPLTSRCSPSRDMFPRCIHFHGSFLMCTLSSPSALMAMPYGPLLAL